MRYLLLICFLVICGFSFAQYNYGKMADTLIKAHIIDKKDKPDIITQLKDNNPPIPLLAILKLELDKAGLSNVDMSLDMLRPKARLTPEQQKKYIPEFKQYIDNLLSVEQISKVNSHMLTDAVDSSYITSRLQLLYLAIDRHVVEQYMNEIRLRPMVDSFLAYGMVDSVSYSNLLSDIRQYKLKDYNDFLPYFKNAVLFSDTCFSANMMHCISVTMQKIAALVPGLTYSGLELMGIDEDIFYNVRISIVANGRRYYGMDAVNKYTTTDGSIFFSQPIGGCIEILNKVLSDERSAYRLVSAIKSDKIKLTNWRVNTVAYAWAVTEPQVTYAHRFYGLLDSGEGNFSEGFHQVMDSVVGNYKSLGLLQYLSPQEIDASLIKLERKGYYGDRDILQAFPNLLFSYNSYVQSNSMPYADILHGLAQISHGAFAPVNIKDDYGTTNGKDGTVSFTWKGNTYSTKVAVHGKRVDDKFFSFVFDIVKQNMPSYAYHYLCQDFHGNNFIFLTDEQYKQAREQNILRFGIDGCK